MAAAAAAAALPAFSGTPTVDAFSAAPEQAADKCLITIDSACSSYANRRHLISMDYSDETLAAIHAGLDELQASPNVHALARVQWKLEDGTLKLLVVMCVGVELPNFTISMFAHPPPLQPPYQGGIPAVCGGGCVQGLRLSAWPLPLPASWDQHASLPPHDAGQVPLL